jgi:hypothetical protein
LSFKVLLIFITWFSMKVQKAVVVRKCWRSFSKDPKDSEIIQKHPGEKNRRWKKKKGKGWKGWLKHGDDGVVGKHRWCRNPCKEFRWR